MGTKRQLEHLKKLNRSRATTPHVNRKSDKAISDGQKLKREMEAKKAAGMWSKGYESEPRK